MTIRLTILDRHQTPILLNPDHVVDVRPRKQVTPVDAQQNPSTQFRYVGVILTMSTGEKHNVQEDIDTVDRLLNPLRVTGTSSHTVVLPETAVPASTVKEPDGPGDGRATTAAKKPSAATEELKKAPAAEE